jgi:hypothetical protein
MTDPIPGGEMARFAGKRGKITRLTGSIARSQKMTVDRHCSLEAGSGMILGTHLAAFPCNSTFFGRMAGVCDDPTVRRGSLAESRNRRVILFVGVGI